MGATWPLSLLSLSVAQEGNVNIEAVTYPVCHAETPHYDSSTDNLIFIDLCGKKFCIHNLLNEETHCTCCLESVSGPIFPIQNTRNEYLAAVGPYLTRMHWDGRNNSRPDFVIIGRFDSDAAPGTELSDGKVDCKGQLFVKSVSGPIFPIQNTTNEYLAAVGPYLTRMYWDGRNNSRPDFVIIGRFDSDAAPGTELSDGKVDCKGQLFVNTRGKLKAGGIPVIRDQASLFRYSKRTCSLEKILDKDKSFYNGLAWNTAYTRFFMVETDEKRVYSFDYDANLGSISNREVLVDFKASNSCQPDGMTIDCSNNLWIACFSFGSVVQVSTESGSILQTLNMPVTDITSVTWGDKDLTTLFVTTSKCGLSDKERREQPLAGSVFAVTGLGYKGVPANSADICTVGCLGDELSCPDCGDNATEIPNTPPDEFDTGTCPANVLTSTENYCRD